ncbi:MAG: hypothetical protein EXR77_01810 [Myxococcales bacterium]|nr:hypothetical protein [Myxococcales bacterium]
MTTNAPLSILFAASAALCACVVATGCEDPKATTTAAADSADVAPTDAAKDTSADTATTGADAATPQDLAQAPEVDMGLECKEIQPCLAKCLADKDFGACWTTCGKDGTSATKTKVGTIGTCAQKYCYGKAPGSARFGCLASKCFESLAACGEWSGSGSCSQSAGCVARCTFGDDACRLACLPKVSSAEVGKFGALTTCGAEKCYSLATSDEVAACIVTQCGTELGACKGEGWNCTQLATCHAKCPPPTGDKPNSCQQICTIFAVADAVDKEKALVDCKSQCNGVLDKTKCIADTCKDKRVACFVDDGTENCNMIFKCINESCKGIGGDAGCIAKCVNKGNAQAKEGWVYYEGCMTLTLESDQAKLAKCSFPYNLSTCINSINGFCSGQHDGCFKPQ